VSFAYFHTKCNVFYSQKKVKKGAKIIKKMHYQIAAIILLCLLIFVGVLYLSQKKQVCNATRYDSFYLLNALKTSNSAVCEKITTKTYKERCLAGVKKNEFLCSTIEGKKDTFCIALAKKDAILCDNNTICRALLTKDSSLCNIDAVALNISVKQAAIIKNSCIAYSNLDAEFFVSKEMLKKC